jgi:hypothetical protein
VGKQKNEPGKRQKSQGSTLLFVMFVWLVVKFLQIQWGRFSISMAAHIAYVRRDTGTGLGSGFRHVRAKELSIALASLRKKQPELN